MGINNAPVLLIILDGFGYKQGYEDNAITPETMPFFFSLLSSAPWTTLKASGTSVGLPEGFPGNSAVGHRTIGAGRIIEQPLSIANRLAREHGLDELPVIKNHFTALEKTQKRLHIMGLLSNGNVHSSLPFIEEIIACAERYGITSTLIHAILDGRDTLQKSATLFLEKIDVPIATIQGRFYAMDRNDNQSRIAQAYAVLTTAGRQEYSSWQEALASYYRKGIYDEIIPPTRLLNNVAITQGDGFILTNIRADRGRELCRLLRQNNDLSFLITGISYDGPYDNADAIIENPIINDTLGDYLEENGISFFTIAESEKYAHITYFLQGGKEKSHRGETRVIIPSGLCNDLIHHPAMKAREITDAVINNITRNDRADFYIINYANADMIGHTGDLNATKKAVAILDIQLERLYSCVVTALNGTLYITGDHGNAEEKRYQSPTHTSNSVYFVVAQGRQHAQLSLSSLDGLADIKDFIINHSLR